MVWCPWLCARKKLVPSTLRIFQDVSHLWRSLSRLLYYRIVEHWSTRLPARSFPFNLACQGHSTSTGAPEGGCQGQSLSTWVSDGWMSRTQSIHMSLRWVDVKDTLHPQESPMGVCQGHTTSTGVSDGWMSRTHYIHRSLWEGCQGHTTSIGVSDRDVKDTLHPQECREWMSNISTSTGISERRHMLVGAFSSIFHMVAVADSCRYRRRS